MQMFRYKVTGSNEMPGGLSLNDHYFLEWNQITFYSHRLSQLYKSCYASIFVSFGRGMLVLACNRICPCRLIETMD